MRLKAGGAGRRHAEFLSFNSILVRLKVVVGTFKMLINKKFQFHFGAIKRQLATGCIIMSFWFQFHSGAIKRLVYCCRLTSSSSCFNSILVRLKVYKYEFLSEEHQRFNSILVRLKGCPLEITIKYSTSFNSILVRLKAGKYLGVR